MLFSRLFQGFIKFTNNRSFYHWRAVRIPQAPLYLVDPKYRANIYKISPPEAATLSNYKKIYFNPSRVIHQYICNDPASKVHDLIIARHDFVAEEQTAKNLITFILSSKRLVDEYVIGCFKTSKYLCDFQNIDNNDLNGFPGVGLTISPIFDIANKQLHELINIINQLGANIPTNLEKNILSLANFVIEDHVFMEMYPLEPIKWYELPKVFEPEKSIELKIKEYHYDPFAKPYYLPKIFKYIIQSQITRSEYQELEILINEDLYMLDSRDPAGVIAHELASRIACEQVFKLIYISLGKFNALPENQHQHLWTKDWEKIYQSYFTGATYLEITKYREAEAMQQFKEFYLTKLSHCYSKNADYDYQNDYPNLKQPLDFLLPEEKSIIKSLYLGEVHRNEEGIKKIFTHAIDQNNLTMFKAILFHLKSLPKKENGSFLEYILSKHNKVDEKLLDLFFAYYYIANGKLLPGGPYNKNLNPVLIKMINDYNIKVKQDEQKQLNLPIIDGLPVYKNYTIKQHFICQEGENNIIFIQKPLCCLNNYEKNEIYQLFSHNFELLDAASVLNRKTYFDLEMSRTNDSSTLELVGLFYDNKKHQLISFLTVAIKQTEHPVIGDFTLIHARLGANDPNYAGSNLTNIALAQLLLAEAIMNYPKDKSTYVFFKSIPPGYALCMMPFYLDFFPKNYIPYSLLERIIHRSDDHISFTKGIECRLKVNAIRTPENLSFPLRFYQSTIGKGVKNAMPIIFSVDRNNSKEYSNLLKKHHITLENLNRYWIPLYLKQKYLKI